MRFNIIKLLYLSLFVLLIGFESKAQTYIEIDAGGTQTLCSDSLTDSDSAGNYSSNETYVITICPDETEGSKVQLMFAAGIDIHPSDTLYVYDGTDPMTDSLLIKVNNNVNNLGVEMSVNATFGNNSGCLTVVFISDGANEGTGWSAGINCFRPCQQVIPDIITTIPASDPNDNTGYIDICFGDTVQFDAQGLYPQSDIGSPWYSQSDASTIFTWYFGDGDSIAGTNLTTVAHAYNFSRNGFTVKLKMEDTLGCNSATMATRKVRVSTIPVFEGLTVLDDTVCYGEAVQVVGGVTGTEGGFLLGGIFPDFLELPDVVGQIYETNILVDAFTPGQTITSIADIQQVCIQMEHSYIGDLEMHLICPDGSTTTLLENPNSGGGTYLGEPVDFESTQQEEEAVGPTYQYCFSATAEYGTWSDEAGNYQYTYTDVLGNTQTDQDYLPAGSYTPYQSFSNLVGCPLNGTWTIQVVDNLSIDNGFIDGWGVFFDPALDPSLETYTPTYDVLDYAWSADVIAISDDTATIQPSSGNWQNIYNFSVTDNHGCTYDTTFTIYTTSLAPQIVGDSTVCDGGVAILEGVGNVNNTCEYTLVLYDSFGDSWNGAGLEYYVEGVLTETYEGNGDSLVFIIEVGNQDSISFEFTSGSFDSECAYRLYDPDGAEVFYVDFGPSDGETWSGFGACGDVGLTYAWYPSDFVNDTTQANVVISPPVNSTYNVIISDSVNGCSDTASINLYLVQNFNYTVTPQDTAICLDGDLTFEAQTEAGTYTYEWLPESLFLNNTTSSVQPLQIPGNYNIIAAITNSFGCTNYDTLTIGIGPSYAPVVDIIGDPGKLCDVDPDSARLYVEITDTTYRGCTYVLDMYDSFGDGWNGGYIQATVNGVRVGPYSAATGQTTTDIDVENGDVVVFTYVSGDWETENTYFFYDSEGNLLFDDGPSPAVGEVFSTVVTCPATIQTYYEYTWSIDATLASNNSDSAQAKPLTNTTYYVTATDAIGGCIGVGAFEVTITSNTFDASITADEYYCNSQAPDTLFVVDPVGYWQGTGMIDTDEGIFDPAVAGTGNHWIHYIIEGGCGTEDSTLITVIDAGSVTITDPGAYCINDPMDTLEVFPTGGSWIGDGIVSPALGIFDPGSAGAGTASVEYSLPKCGTTGSITLLVNSSFDADFTGTTAFCDGGQPDTVYFTGVDPGGVWSGPGIVDSTAGGFDPSIANQGFNYVKYEFLTGCKDFDIDTIFVGIQKDATIDSIGDICIGSPVQQFTAADNSGTWSGDGIIDPSGLFDPSEAAVGNNTVYYKISGGCGDADTVKIVISTGPSISMDVNGETCELAEDGSVDVTALGGVKPYVFNWDNGDSTAIITSLKPGKYMVSITDATGCTVLDSAYVEASTELCETPTIFVGNIFSPNGDNANDVLTPRGKNIASMDFVIYNRWGEKVYETSTFGDGWDGTYKGQDATMGVYVYYLRAVLRNGQVDEQRGNVTLVR